MQSKDVVFKCIPYSQLIPNTNWNEHLSALLEFKQHWGHCDVTQKYANWAIQRRHKYRLLKSGKKSFIKNYSIVQLENVEFK